jgi:SAC3/GANP family
MPGWGASNAPPPSSGAMIFGSSPNIAAPTPSFASNAPPNTPFVAPFASVVATNNSYSATTTSNAVGAPPTQVHTPFATPFANAPSSTPFVLSQQPFSTLSTSPFAQFSSAAPTSSSVAFGVSANVMSSSPIPGAGAPPQSLPWNAVASSSVPFQPQQQQQQLFPFSGTSSTLSATPQTSFHVTSSFAAQDGMEDEDGPPSVNEPPSLAESNKVQRDLAALQAKIAEKKKKIEEKRQRELEEKGKESLASSLRADAAPFQPVANAAEVAQRNAVRFAESTDPATKSQLPADLLEQSANLAAQSALRNQGAQGGRAHLEQAVSLVGTCPHMCPDEELLRREREGDIQLLERPDPQVHPETWTLRDTMVKRFRRSAADYKLDVPEWIRPPDVLERVCSYLEEWVMVRRVMDHFS